MHRFYHIEEVDGVFETVLPPFDHTAWPEIVPEQGYVWISNPGLEIAGKLDSILSQALFQTDAIDLKSSIHRLEFDVSIPAADFLQFAASKFTQGIDFILSEKHQPAEFQWSSLPRHSWPGIMAQNQITLVFHRPAGGEPSKIISPSRDILKKIIDRSSSR